SARCLDTQVTTFVKITGKTSHDISESSLLLRSSEEQPITIDCINRCRSSLDCQAVVVDYEKNACFNSTAHANRYGNTVSEKINYFEKICLQVAGCNRIWTLEEVRGRELVGMDDRVIEAVATKLRCQELCLQEREFRCHSGEYDHILLQCRLSVVDRRQRPSSFKPANDSVYYFDNLCVKRTTDQCSYREHEDLDIDRHDLLLLAFTVDQCQALCDGNREFLCRSFTFLSSAARCWLSGDDTFSITEKTHLVSYSGRHLYDRTDCMRITLSCSQDTMTLHVETQEPFKGKIFSQSKPRTCKYYGQGQRNTSFSMPLQLPKCGITKEDQQSFINTLVVQEHPIIQRKVDHVILLRCIINTKNNTVIGTTNITVRGGSTPSSVVNATAPSPYIRLKITDSSNQEITGTKLGEDLSFQIETNNDSIFDISARELVARNGRSDEFITLLDDRGCPIDPKIFPILERVPNTKILQGNFEAFKFTEDMVVRFQVKVHFCVDQCEVVSCGPNRKRRQVQDTVIFPDFPLQKEIIVEGITVVKLNKEDKYNVTVQDKGVVCTSKRVVAGITVGLVLLLVAVLGICLGCFILKKSIKKQTLLARSEK
ncbi:EGF-like domain-containing protein 2, partial [Limulus polyphemus]|uniref:EGF-like domain-containing protein 2 n=1 Tax=Limulus polyphemus TaxID=6850 RepID=A0ABM1TNE1_LIMPO